MAHIKMGEVLAGLKDDILVLGSGFSFHNLRAFFSQDTNESQVKNRAFEEWLIETCTSHELKEDERAQRLVNWEKAPSAR